MRVGPLFSPTKLLGLQFLARMVSIKALQPSSFRAWGFAMLTAAIMGLMFGSAFYKSRVFEPYVIRGTFLFRRFIMLKASVRNER